jgi:hypothetical protein
VKERTDAPLILDRRRRQQSSRNLHRLSRNRKTSPLCEGDVVSRKDVLDGAGDLADAVARAKSAEAEYVGSLTGGQLAFVQLSDVDVAKFDREQGGFRDEDARKVRILKADVVLAKEVGLSEEKEGSGQAVSEGRGVKRKKGRRRTSTFVIVPSAREKVALRADFKTSARILRFTGLLAASGMVRVIRTPLRIRFSLTTTAGGMRARSWSVGRLVSVRTSSRRTCGSDPGLRKGAEVTSRLTKAQPIPGRSDAESGFRMSEEEDVEEEEKRDALK